MNCKDHIIDFFVIFAADVMAALVVINCFEIRREKLAHRQNSLRKLCKLLSIVQKKYETKIDSYKDSVDSVSTKVAKDIDDDDREFSQLDSDEAFWEFKNSKRIRDQYRSIKSFEEKIEINTVGDVRVKFSKLIALIKDLREECKSISSF